MFQEKIRDKSMGRKGVMIHKRWFTEQAISPRIARGVTNV